MQTGLDLMSLLLLSSHLLALSTNHNHFRYYVACIFPPTLLSFSLSLWLSIFLIFSVHTSFPSYLVHSTSYSSFLSFLILPQIPSTSSFTSNLIMLYLFSHHWCLPILDQHVYQSLTFLTVDFEGTVYCYWYFQMFYFLIFNDAILIVCHIWLYVCLMCLWI